MADYTNNPHVISDLNLLEEISKAIIAYKNSQSLILAKAEEEGGEDMVAQIRSEFEILEDTYYEVRDRLLDGLDARYADLSKAANDATKALKADIDDLQKAEKVLKNLTKAVSAIARLMVALGI